MKFFWILQSGFKSFALFGQYMNDDGLIASLGKFQCADQQRQIMAVNRAEITHTHLFENQTAAITAASIGIYGAGIGLEAHFGEHAFESFLRLMCKFQSQFAFRQAAYESLEILRELVVGRMSDQLVQIRRDGTDIF